MPTARPLPRSLCPSLSPAVRIEPVCAAKPSFVFEGVAQDVTSPTLRRKFRSPRYEIMRVGETQMHLSSEFEPGWPPALRMKAGQLYAVEVFESSTRLKEVSKLPLDVRTEDGLVFYCLARELQPRKDDADQRRVLRDFVAGWTDGLMLSTGPDSGHKLEAGRVYKVVVRAVAQNA